MLVDSGSPRLQEETQLVSGSDGKPEHLPGLRNALGISTLFCQAGRGHVQGKVCKMGRSVAAEFCTSLLALRSNSRIVQLLKVDCAQKADCAELCYG